MCSRLTPPEIPRLLTFTAARLIVSLVFPVSSGGNLCPSCTTLLLYILYIFQLPVCLPVTPHPPKRTLFTIELVFLFNSLHHVLYQSLCA